MTAGFGASTFAFVWRERVLDSLRRLQALGLDGFDVILAPGHCWPAELSRAERASLARTLDADGIRLASLNFPALDLNLASPVPEVRRYAIELYGAALRLAAELGVPAVVAVPGRVSTLIRPPAAETERWLIESVETLLALAETTGRTLHLELHPQSAVPTVDDLARVVQLLDHPRLRIAYDVANAEFVGEEHLAALNRLAPQLGQVHLSDSTRTRWAHDRVGRGTVDFGAVLRALRDMSFDGPRVLEVVTPTPVEDLEASLAALVPLEAPA